MGPLVLSSTSDPFSKSIVTSRGRSTSGPRAVSALAPDTGVARADPPISPAPSTTSPTVTNRVLRSMDSSLSFRLSFRGGQTGRLDRSSLTSLRRIRAVFVRIEFPDPLVVPTTRRDVQGGRTALEACGTLVGKALEAADLGLPPRGEAAYGGAHAVPDPGTARGGRRGWAAAPGRPEAEDGPGPPGPSSEPGHGPGAADRGGVGRGASAGGPEHPSRL